MVANEVAGDPRPDAECELAVQTTEGRVFHRRENIPRLRSVTEIDSRPNERFAPAEISRIADGRNRLEAEVAVPPGENPALLIVSRPFFAGYVAKVGDRVFEIGSYRALMPLIELPPGTKGRLTIVYRPWWLIWGGTIAAATFAAMLGCAVLAAMARRSA